MKRSAHIAIIIATLSLASLVSVFAEGATTSWPYFVEVTPGSTGPGYYSLTVPLEVMGKSTDDLADLRLYDGKGAEIPYALWVRRDVDEVQEVSGRIFNQASAGAASEVSVDLGEDNRGEHNQLEIETEGMNFRRRVEIEGSDSGKDWKTLTTGGVIFAFQSQNSSVHSDRVSYPTSRYRYLRVKVFADDQVDKKAPVITNVTASMAVHEKGQQVTWSTTPLSQFLRHQGAPASAWTIDFGARVPCDRLLLEINAESFSRPFEVENIDDPQNIRLVASGELTRRVSEERKPLPVVFDQEEHVRKLRLLVTDYSNQPLPIYSFTAGAAARQLIFELKDGWAPPLRLFFGNPKAVAPHYDFARDLSGRLSSAPLRSETGVAVANPDFKPEPLPLTERVPWLIYVVLTSSSLALGLILFSLARTSMRQKANGSNGGTVESKAG